MLAPSELTTGSGVDRVQLPRCVIVGAGRLGNALERALAGAGVPVFGPLRRGEAIPDADLVLLCVPDRAIAQVAQAVSAELGQAGNERSGEVVGKAQGGDGTRPGPILGHCSGLLGLDVLGTTNDRLGLHPLLSISGDGEDVDFTGATAAIAGSTPEAIELARTLADQLSMRPLEIADADRPIYHAAASVAANFSVALWDFAEQLAKNAGVQRDQLVPLIESALKNWQRSGGPTALTGPISRGDDETVRRQRAEIERRAPDQVAFFDALLGATERLVRRGEKDEP